MTELEKATFDKIEEIYATEKGKGFITAMMRSFFPFYKSRFKVLIDPTGKQ